MIAKYMLINMKALSKFFLFMILVVGFGLAGDEFHFPPKLFIKTFDMLKQNRFPITVHAGEWDGPERLWDGMR